MQWLDVPILLGGLAFFFMKVERQEERLDALKNDFIELRNEFRSLPKRREDRDT